MKYLKFSQIEIDHLLKSWFAIAIAFAIAMNSDNLSFTFFTSFSFLTYILFSAITVGTAFLFHEMGHKYMAQKYGCFAEFRADFKMLVVAILISFTGFIFAAPGAVMISGNINNRKYGIISLAGPFMNFVMALLFLSLLFIPITSLKTLGFYGYFINSWIGIFNLLPIMPFDGIKILKWNMKIYFTSVFIFVVMLLIGLKLFSN